jgi:LPXTG-site transpeptidase (sortase) family protein
MGKKNVKIGAKITLILSNFIVFILPIVLVVFCYFYFLKYGEEKIITVAGSFNKARVLGSQNENIKMIDAQDKNIDELTQEITEPQEPSEKLPSGIKEINRQDQDSIIISSINVKAPIVWSIGKTEEEFQADMRKGVIHYPGTAKPGQMGNIFITGHSTYYKSDPGKFKNVFIRLGELEVGDQVDIITDGKNRFEYEIFQIEPVWPDDQRIFDFDNKSEKILTLATCWPIGSYEKRLMIKARQTN